MQKVDDVDQIERKKNLRCELYTPNNFNELTENTSGNVGKDTNKYTVPIWDYLEAIAKNVN